MYFTHYICTMQDKLHTIQYASCLRNTHSQTGDPRTPYPNDGPTFHGGGYLKPALSDHLPFRERKAYG
jgi:hypothetical protein